MVRYLYNSSGEWIAFCKGVYVFNTECEWIGWIPQDDNVVVDIDGQYLGTIVDNNRLYRFYDEPFSGCTACPRYPGHPGYPEYPGCTWSSTLPAMAADINTSLVEVY